MEAQRKDEAQERAGMFGTPSRRAVIGASCAVAAGAVLAGDWGVHAVWACSAALLAAFGLMLAGR